METAGKMGTAEAVEGGRRMMEAVLLEYDTAVWGQSGAVAVMWPGVGSAAAAAAEELEEGGLS